MTNLTPSSNFARILSVAGGQCVLHRQGDSEIAFTFYIVDEEAEEIYTPTIKMDWPGGWVVDHMFTREDGDVFLTQKAEEAWEACVKALNSMD